MLQFILLKPLFYFIAREITPLYYAAIFAALRYQHYMTVMQAYPCWRKVEQQQTLFVSQCSVPSVFQKCRSNSVLHAYVTRNLILGPSLDFKLKEKERKGRVFI